MRILSARQYKVSLKVTIQKTGKLNFTEETAKALALTPDKGAKLFMDGEPEQLYMAIMPKVDDDSFQIHKSGTYYYVPARLLFDDLGVDYTNNTVIYDLVRCKAYDEQIGGECYKMNQRTLKKKAYERNVDE
jgi:hypothetical protein